MKASLPIALLAAAAVVASTGCTDDKKRDAAPVASASAEGPQKPLLNGKLAAAVKAAESAAPAAKAVDGPPENGVFAAGQADKAQAPGAPAKIDVISEGKAPGFTFTLSPAGEQKEIISITVRIQGGAIPVEYAVLFKTDKPKDAAPGASYRVVGKVAAVGAPPQIPRELSDKLVKLKGAEIRYTLSAAGGASDVSYAVAKDADPGLGDLVVRGLADAIALASPPLPSKPIGVGGSWIVADRAATLGVEVVRYRVYTVDKIDGAVASLSLQTRQYAAKEDVDLGAVANSQKLTLQRFESTGLSKIDWTGTSIISPHADTSLKTGMAGTVGGGQQAGLQAETIGRFSADTGDKKR